MLRPKNCFQCDITLTGSRASRRLLQPSIWLPIFMDYQVIEFPIILEMDIYILYDHSVSNTLFLRQKIFYDSQSLDD